MASSTRTDPSSASTPSRRTRKKRRAMRARRPPPLSTLSTPWHSPLSLPPHPPPPAQGASLWTQGAITHNTRKIERERNINSVTHALGEERDASSVVVTWGWGKQQHQGSTRLLGMGEKDDGGKKKNIGRNSKKRIAEATSEQHLPLSLYLGPPCSKTLTDSQ